MAAQGEAHFRSLEEQLVIDLQAFLFASDAAVRFADLRASFPTVSAIQLIDALANLEAQNVVSLSIRHNAVLRKTTRATQSLKPLQ